MAGRQWWPTSVSSPSKTSAGLTTSRSIAESHCAKPFRARPPCKLPVMSACASRLCPLAFAGECSLDRCHRHRAFDHLVPMTGSIFRVKAQACLLRACVYHDRLVQDHFQVTAMTSIIRLYVLRTTLALSVLTLLCAAAPAQSTADAPTASLSPEEIDAAWQKATA